MALPQRHRLRQSRDFQRLYSRGKRFKTENLTLLKMPQPVKVVAVVPAAQIRLGVVISQKVSKRAVVRNRIRRRLHMAFQLLCPSLSLGWDLVLVVHPPAVECDYRQFLRELEQLLRRAEVLHGG